MNVVIQANSKIDLSGLISRTAYAKLAGSEAQLDLWIKSSSVVWAGKAAGKVVCIWGMRAPTLLSDNAYLWLLTTEELEDHKFLFIRHSQLAVAEILKMYPTIHGHYKAGDLRSKKWLEWLGAKFGEAVDGIYPFTIRHKHG